MGTIRSELYYQKWNIYYQKKYKNIRMETLGAEVNYILPEVPHKTKSKRSPENMTRSIIVSLG